MGHIDAMFRSAAFVLALAATAACRPAPTTTPADVDARLLRIEEHLLRLTGVIEASPDRTSMTPDQRLVRVENQLDKVITFLKTAVPAKLDESKVYALPIDPLDPVVGPPTAAVTVVEAYEFLCPYCAMVEPTLDELRARYPTDLRVVSKYYVIHGEPAMPSGKAACAAARQGKYAAIKDRLWKSIWPTAGEAAVREQATAEAVARTAKAAGLDMKRYQADVDGVCSEWLTRSGATMQKFGAGGTPSFWINGRPFQTASRDEFAGEIEAELARVKASGVAPAKYYEQVVMAKGEPEAVMVSPFD